jgi:hypothetical protein
MPQIRLPDPPVPHEHRILSLDQIAKRWRTRVSVVRILLLRGGVPLVDVQRIVEGARLADVEVYEQKLRNGEED